MSNEEYDDDDTLSAARGITTAVVWAIWAVAAGMTGSLMWRVIQSSGRL